MALPSRSKLKKGDISLKEMFLLSKHLYRSKKVDDKSKRAKLDVLGAKIRFVRNYIWDEKEKKWVQTAKRHIRFEFLVRTDPISYPKIDDIKIHVYPIYFLFYDIENMGLDSPFRWRAGSFKKPVLNKNMSAKDKANINIKKQIQLQFFFHLMNVLARYGLLYGPDTTNKKLPRKTNPQLLPYFDKHSLWVVEKILLKLLSKSNREKFLKKINKEIKK